MNVLDVLLEKTRVGFLERDDEEYRFSFDDNWLEMDTDERPVLGQIFEDRMPYDIVSEAPPCWFAHLLPQGPLLRMIARDAGVEPEDDFDILQYIGEDLPGAVLLQPGTDQPNKKTHPISEATHPTDGRLRFSSLAGAQWKLSVHEGDRGIVLPVEGGIGNWIAKFHNPEFKDLPRVEYATMTWAKHVGIDVPPIRLGNIDEFIDLPAGIPTGDGTVFFIERFDRRPKSGRIHMEDFGQVLDRPPGNRADGQYSMRYEHLAAVIAQLCGDDLRRYCQRVVFCVLSGNGDAHLKNWSLIYPDHRNPRLSPAYDLVSTVLYSKLDDFLALELGKSRRYEDVDAESFALFARAIDGSQAEVTRWAIDFAQKVRTVWQEQASDFAYTATERERISKHLARVPLGR